MTESLVSVHELRVHFHERGVLARGRPPVRAVDGVDLDIAAGEVVGLVGESGSGKTTLGRTLLGLIRPSAGQVIFAGHDLTGLRSSALRKLRREMQMVFQDPHSSLSPRLRVAYLLMEPYRINDTPPERRYGVEQLLEMVGLSPELAVKFPHELSGGQARRVGIARALAMRPRLLIADEPTAGLDISAAVAVLNLLKDLGDEFGLSYLIITHNLEVVSYIADRVAVMYLGRIVEQGPTATVFRAPAHPYTRALLSAVSEPDPRRRRARRMLLPGEIPSPRNPPPGCRFHPRCPLAEDRCRSEDPTLEPLDDNHYAACHFRERVRALSLDRSLEGAQGPGT